MYGDTVRELPGSDVDGDQDSGAASPREKVINIKANRRSGTGSVELPEATWHEPHIELWEISYVWIPPIPMLTIIWYRSFKY